MLPGRLNNRSTPAKPEVVSSPPYDDWRITCVVPRLTGHVAVADERRKTLQTPVFEVGVHAAPPDPGTQFVNILRPEAIDRLFTRFARLHMIAKDSARQVP
jgi:hypothetical protein